MDLGDSDDEPTDPTSPATPAAIRIRAGEQLASSFARIANAIALLENVEGSEREYFCQRLADDIVEVCNGGLELANAVRFAGLD